MNVYIAHRDNRRASSGAVPGRLRRNVGAVFLAAHGLVHLLGVVVLWHLAEPGSLRYEDLYPAPGTWPAAVAGVGWLLAAAGFVLAGVFHAVNDPRWRVPAAGAAALSLVLLGPSVRVTFVGLIIDVAVVLAIMVTLRPVRRVIDRRL